MSQAKAKVNRQAIRKALGPEVVDLVAQMGVIVDGHEHNLTLTRDILERQAAEDARLRGSFWARMRWLVVGR